MNGLRLLISCVSTHSVRQKACSSYAVDNNATLLFPALENVHLVYNPESVPLLPETIKYLRLASGALSLNLQLLWRFEELQLCRPGFKGNKRHPISLVVQGATAALLSVVCLAKVQSFKLGSSVIKAGRVQHDWQW